MKTISVPYIDKLSGTTANKDVKGVRIAGTVFAITEPIGFRERWSLTHLPTGYRVAGMNVQRPLRAMAKRLNALPTASVTDPELIKADRLAWVSIIREETDNVVSR